MTNKELIFFFGGLYELDNLKGIKLSYAVMINKKRIKAEVEALDAGLKNYDNERIKINEKYAKAGANGRPVIENRIFQIRPECMAQCEKEIAELQGKYKQEIDDYNALMDEEAEVSIHKITYDEATKLNPDITPRQLMILGYMLHDPPWEKEEEPVIPAFAGTGAEESNIVDLPKEKADG